MKRAVFSIVDMECVSCAITIDGDLEEKEGIKEAKTNYAKSQTTVTFDPKQISEAEIVAIMKKSGYTATLQKDL